jgi:di/tripeptidase
MIRPSVLLVLLAVASSVEAQSAYPTRLSEAIVQRAEVREALAFIDRHFDSQVAEWIRLTDDVLRYLGVELPRGREAIATGSTDANVGVLHGIPSVTAGRSRGGNGHTPQEWSDIESAKIGTKQIILLAAALAELP